MKYQPSISVTITTVCKVQSEDVNGEVSQGDVTNYIGVATSQALSTKADSRSLHFTRLW